MEEKKGEVVSETVSEGEPDVEKNESPKSPGKGSKNSKLVLGLVVGVFVLLVALVAAVFGVVYLMSERNEDAEDEDSTEEIVVEDEEEEEDEEELEEEEEVVVTEPEEDDAGGTPVLSEATDDDTWLFPSGIFDEYTYLRTICDGYAGFDPDVYFMDVEYPDTVTLSTNWNSSAVNPDCHLQFTYDTSMMRVQFDVGEAYPRTLTAGFQELMTEGGETLVRTSMSLAEGMYGYSYYTKMADAECAPSEMIPDLAAPCALPIHPYLPGATMIYVAIPESTGLSERGDIIDLFDDIAKRMHGGEN